MIEEAHGGEGTVAEHSSRAGAEAARMAETNIQRQKSLGSV